MTRFTASAIAALMLGGASVAWAAGADKTGADMKAQTGTDAGQSAGSSSGAAAGQSSTSGSTSSQPSTSSGSAAGTASAMTEAQVQDRLEAQGYTQVSGLKKSGDKFEAKAMKDGKSVNLEIDAKTGMIKDKAG